MLTRLLRDEPTADIIDAISPLADEDCIVQLGRIARTSPVLSTVALEALEAIGNPRAQAIVETIRGAA